MAQVDYSDIPNLVFQCKKFGDFLLEDRFRNYNKNQHLPKRFNEKWTIIKVTLDEIGNEGRYRGNDMTPEIRKHLESLLTTISHATNRTAATFDAQRQPRRLFASHKDEMEETYRKISNWHKEILTRLALVNSARPGTFHNVPTLQKPAIQAPRSTMTFSIGQPSASTVSSVPMKDILLPHRPPVDLHRLRFSGVWRSQSHPHILVEYRPFDRTMIGDKTRLDEARYNVYSLVTMLKSADPYQMSILRADGVYIAEHDQGYELQLQIPHGLDDPRSLRDLLADPVTPKVVPSFSSRFRFAKKLASSIVYMHASVNFVHKMIKPENILVLTPSDDPESDVFPSGLGLPFLVGFDRSRPASSHSSRYGEGEMQDCLYQHPSRWGILAEEAFSMSHDIYSLGVVLLEVGLWKPFVKEIDGKYAFANNLVDFVDRATGGPGNPRVDRRLGQDLQARLVHVAQTELPRNMGPIYTQVVLSCLTVLDDGNVPASTAETPDVVGFIRFVLSELESLHV
jgi:hypothetical protein